MVLNKDSGVYSITCIPTGELYIGSSKNIEGRCRGHYKRLRKDGHENPLLQLAWNRYGEENFELNALEYCLREDVIEAEQDAINEHKKKLGRKMLFNINMDAFRPPVPDSEVISARNKKRWSEDLEFRKMMSETSSRTMNKLWSDPEFIEKMTTGFEGENNPFYGKKHTEETKKKISEACKGRKMSPETLVKMSAASKGRVFGEPSLEHIRNQIMSRGFIPFTLGEIKEIDDLILEGRSQQYIADEFEMGRNPIRNVMKRQKVYKNIPKPITDDLDKDMDMYDYLIMVRDRSE